MSDERTDAEQREGTGDGEADEAQEEMRKLEEGEPPQKLEDWPSGDAKYETYGGAEGGHSYEEGPESKLGPSGLRHHEDGSVTIDGEQVDDPDEYKGEPIPGGPTDESSDGASEGGSGGPSEESSR